MSKASRNTTRGAIVPPKDIVTLEMTADEAEGLLEIILSYMSTHDPEYIDLAEELRESLEEVGVE